MIFVTGSAHQASFVPAHSVTGRESCGLARSPLIPLHRLNAFTGSVYQAGVDGLAYWFWALAV